MLEIIQRLRLRWKEVSTGRQRKFEDPEQFITDLSAIDNNQLIISPEGLPSYKSWDSVDMNTDARNERDEQLLDYFAGWSAMNIGKYRSFTVIDTNHNNKTAKHSCHIFYRDPVTFVQEESKRRLDRST